ncbi:hypothetical protein BK133_26100 [Paenibacillus sp. FSL H8-0548]|uniref:copper amine oxidase N-terminal domain-containing protein n=1 Tax=Paenibacillus sp. FSL H8-0548 TaxID=1920422 RepID=UPI00096CBEC0|nr:copper amine oxidase N-terminal domain-containing protein [Paenibacillus sp. FSL H8-0548]OMF22516.1 hypothetical protein BK133_26100 [Paenibacillus sp. FSL H8-0548]
MKKWMKTAAAALTVAGVLSVGSAAMAASAPQSVKMFINGVYQQDVLNVNGRTMVQLRAFNDPAKISYTYESATKTIIINNTAQKKTIRLKDGLKTADVNGKSIALDAPVTVQKGRTYVPARFVTETLGGTVAYNSTTKQVIVRTPTGVEQFETLKSGDLAKARELALNLTRLNNGIDVRPYGEGFTTVYTFPKGEALRFFWEYKGLLNYIEINVDGLAEMKWQKDTLGVNGEAGKEPMPFGESVYFSDHFMADLLSYGTIDSEGNRTEIDAITGYSKGIIVPIEGEVRTDTK